MNYILEAVVDSVAGAVAAQQGGAHRIELCAALMEGGITPSAAIIELTRRHVTLPIFVMIRPRGGDFVYSDLELDVMHRDIELAKQLGADGIVLGVLHTDGSIDATRTKALIQTARPLPVTFHRAFDMVADPHYALDALIRLGVTRVLTSGQEATALEGTDLIADLVRQAAGRMIVMPGGGITERNIARIAQATGARELHMSARRSEDSPMHYRNPRVHLGGALHTPDYSRSQTSADRIRASLDALNAS